MKTENIQRIKEKIPIGIINISIICINFLILQFATRGIGFILSIQILYGFINLGIIVAFVGIAYSLVGKQWVSEFICSLLCAIYSIVNQYVIEFHGSPLTIPEFSNAATAINVLSGYSLVAFKPLVFISLIGILLVVDIFLCKILKNYEIQQVDKKQKKSIIRRVLFFLCGFIYIGAILSSTSLIEPIQKCWHFKEAIGKYGYPLYFFASGLEYEVAAPIGYSEERIELIPIDYYSEKLAENNQTPDIILILNETFYDISLVADVKTDVDYMGQFYNMDNAISGYAVVPKIGGGTNNSEYELLTSNSTYLFQGITPFQTLDMSDSTSMVSNLKELGYYTIGMHPAAAGNYARNTGYALLGFDEIHFEDDFIDNFST